MLVSFVASLAMSSQAQETKTMRAGDTPMTHMPGCGPQKFRLPLRVGNSERGHEKVSLLLEVSEVVIG